MESLREVRDVEIWCVQSQVIHQRGGETDTCVDYPRDRRAAWTMTQCTVNAEEQTSLSKLMGKDYHGEVAKLLELSWVHSIAKQSKLAEQWKDTHFGWKVETSR